MIKISRVELKNFRRYESADFRFNSKNPLSVILALNGVGKSTFFDALTWCFFEKEDYRSRKKEKESLLSFSKRDKMSPGSMDCVEVTIFLEEVGTKNRFKITRTKPFELSSDSQNLSSGHSKVIIKKFNDKIEDWELEEHPSSFIEKLIPTDLRQFFFFDGENLLKTFNDNTSDYLEKKIKEVSRVEIIERIEDYLITYESYLESKKRKDLKSKKDKEKYMRDLKFEKDKLNGFIQEKNKISLEIKKFEKLKEGIRDRKEHYAPIEEKGKYLKQSVRISTEREKEVAEKIRNLKTSHKNYIIYNAPIVFGINEIKKSLELIDKGRELNEIPPPWTKEDLEKLIENEKCICSQNLSEFREGKNKYREIIIDLINKTRIKKSIPWDEFTKELNGFISIYEDFFHQIKNNKEILNNENAKLISIQKEIEEKNIQIEKLEGGDDWTQIILDERKVEERLRELYAEEGKIGNQIGIVNATINSKSRFESSMNFKTSEEERINKKLEFCKKAQAFLLKFKQNLVSKNRIKLMGLTEKYFRKLCSEKNNELGEIIIDEYYNLKLIRKDKKTAMGLSEGEDLLFVLSFGSALKDITKIDAPFVIDSPLGKIDSIYRKKIADFYLEILQKSQIILLVTDTEFDNKFEEIFRKNIKDFDYHEVARDNNNTSINKIRKINQNV